MDRRPSDEAALGERHAGLTSAAGWSWAKGGGAFHPLLSAGLMLELVTWLTRKPTIRFGTALADGLMVGLIWAWAVA